MYRRIRLRRWRHHLAPRHDVLRSTDVLHGADRAGPTGGGRDSLRWGLLGPPPRRGPQGQGPVYTAHPSAPIEASQASWNSTSRFLVPRGTGQPHNLGTAQRRERRGWCGTWDEKMTWGNTMTKAKTAPMRFQDVSTKPDEGEREASSSRTKPDETRRRQRRRRRRR